jgi:hypothetical protein
MSGEKHFDQANRTLYLSGMADTFVYTPDRLSKKGEFISLPIPVTANGFSDVQLSGVSTESVKMQFRTSSSPAYRFERFNSFVAGDWGDVYSWGYPANTVSEAGGIVTLTNFTDAGSGYHWFKLNVPANTFPVGSVVTAKIRFNTSAQDFLFTLVENGWEPGNNSTAITNQWVTLAFKSTGSDLQNVGFMWNCNTPCLTTDTLQVEELVVQAGDSKWSSWSTLVNNGDSINADLSGAAYLQYKAVLTSEDRLTTPVLKSASLSSSFSLFGEGVLVSSFDKAQKPHRILLEVDQPNLTSVALKYSLDNGVSWVYAPIENSTFTFPESTPLTEKVLIKVELATSDQRNSPKVKSVRVEAYL